EEEEAPSELPVRIEIARVLVEGGRARYDSPGEAPRSFEGLSLALSATVAKDAIAARLDALSLTSTAPRLDVSVRARAEIRDRALNARLDADASEAKLRIALMPFDLDTSTGTATVHLVVPPLFYRRLGLPEAFAPDV